MAHPPAPSPTLRSRLPRVGTTIFSVMSALAERHGAVNLGQGFPDFPCDPALTDAVARALDAGRNQYAPMPGVASLRAAVSARIASAHGHTYDPDREITITAGATQAILTAVFTCIAPGDEVVVLEPAYDSYGPSVELAGGRVVRVPLHPETFRPDFDRVAAAIGPRTRAVLVNSPHNPTATVWTPAEMDRLAELLDGTEVMLISDEVYEPIVFDGRPHVSAARVPRLRDRSFVISSFGKAYHVTGWKVGAVAAPAAWTAEFRKVHQFNVFCVNAPMQHGLSDYVSEAPTPAGTRAFFTAKRDLFRRGLDATRLRPLPCEGSYFQCVDYGAVSDLPDEAFCRQLVETVGVAAIPLSAFGEGAEDQRIIRFCFAKRDETLTDALTRLARL